MKTMLNKPPRLICITVLSAILLSGCSTFLQPKRIKDNCATSTLLMTDLTQTNMSDKTMLPNGETCPSGMI